MNTILKKMINVLKFVRYFNIVKFLGTKLPQMIVNQNALITLIVLVVVVQLIHLNVIVNIDIGLKMINVSKGPHVPPGPLDLQLFIMKVYPLKIVNQPAMQTLYVLAKVAQLIHPNAIVINTLFL